MKKLTPLITPLFIGLILTLGSVIVNYSSAFPDCSGFNLSKVEKGFPIPYIHVQPSVSLCNSVSSISVFWHGNAAHQEYPLAFIADDMFWSLAVLGVLTLRRHKSG
jgi:hypothetical protein